MHKTSGDVLRKPSGVRIGSDILVFAWTSIMLDVVLSAALRLCSWMLGLLDMVYLRIIILGRCSLFFEDGYGDLEEELRLQTFIRGEAAFSLNADITCMRMT
jgi:hypothetical protein